MSDVREAVRSTDRYRLLGHPTDLAAHVATLGPAPLPAPDDRSWRASFLSALEASGLTGRGGAGFPAAIKLSSTAAAGPGGTVVVNAMEGEPASDKDKLLLLRSPHLVLDGAQLLAVAAGAHRVTVCVPEGREHVASAVSRAMAERVVARCAPATEQLVRPPDRFVAGEESALVAWIRTNRSLPSFRPDKGIPLRIGRQAALVHNTETLAHVAMIARTGPEAFRARGLVEEPGTTLVTISGAVEQPGVVETDRGTPLDDIVRRATPIGPPRGAPRGGLRRSLGRPRPLHDALCVDLAARRRSQRRRRSHLGARTRRLRPHGDRTTRLLPRIAECRTVRSLRLRSAGHCGRPRPPCPR